MDTRTIEVEHRLDELRRCSDDLRAARAATRAARASSPSASADGPWTELRLALGRRLVAVGTALQDGAAGAAGPSGSARTSTH